jgi:hypothetical protein
MEPGIQGSVILAGEYYPFLMYAGDNTPGLYIRTPLGIGAGLRELRRKTVLRSCGLTL